DRRGAGRPLPARGPRRARLRGGAADASAQPCPRGRGRGHAATQPRGQGAALLLRHADRPPAARGRRVRQRARAGAGGLRPLPRGTAGPGLPADGRAAPPGAPHAADARRAPCARESHTWSKPPAAAASRCGTSSALSSGTRRDSGEGCARARYPAPHGCDAEPAARDAAATPVAVLTPGNAPAIGRATAPPAAGSEVSDDPPFRPPLGPAGP